MANQNQKISEKQKVIITNLLSKNDEEVISFIQELRETGELFIVQPLLDMLFTSRSQRLKDSIFEFLEDIKSQDVVPIITQTIKKHIDEKEMAGLVSVCWQSSLDFSNDLDLFVEILCKSDFQTAFETSTVIENSIGAISQEQRNAHVAYIKKMYADTSKEKQSLLAEVIDMIGRFTPNDDNS